MINLIDKQTLPNLTLNIKSSNSLAINEAYRRLKLAGWMSTEILHPNDNVPVFKLEIGKQYAFIW